MPTSPNPLLDRLQAWTLEAAASATALLQLYTQLGDERQRQRALRVLDAARVRLTQTGQGSTRLPQIPLLSPDDTAAELATWCAALEASTGVLVFLTLAKDTDKPVFGLRGQYSHFSKASEAAMKGLQCAFPEETAWVETQRVIHHVLEACRMAFCTQFHQNPETLEGLLDAIRVALESHLAG